MNHWTWLAVYGALFVESLAVALALGPMARRLGRRWRFVAHPGGRHAHAEPTPLLGGSTVVAAFLIVILGNLTLAHFLHDAIRERYPEVGKYLVNIPSVLTRLGAVAGGALAMWVLGLIDDRRPLGPRLKLAIMVLAALPLLAVGIRIQGFLPWPWMGAAVTLVWVVFLTNAFNFMDNMDGLCGGVAAIVTAAFGLVSFFAGEWFMTAVYAVLAGALVGFLFHNFRPMGGRARLFLGDNGSLFLGYLLGALSILATYYRKGVPTTLPVLTPLIVLGVPVFDTLSVVWIRLRTGRPLMQGDRNHFSHRLVDLGMSPRRAVVFIYILTAAIGLSAVPLRTVGRVGGVVILVQIALLFWVIFQLERTAAGKSR